MCCPTLAGSGTKTWLKITSVRREWYGRVREGPGRDARAAVSAAGVELRANVEFASCIRSEEDVQPRHPKSNRVWQQNESGGDQLWSPPCLAASTVRNDLDQAIFFFAPAFIWS